MFGVDTFNYSETERAYILSEKMTAFFKKLHLATTLAELKIDDMDFDAMAARGNRCGSFLFYLGGGSLPLIAALLRRITPHHLSRHPRAGEDPLSYWRGFLTLSKSSITPSPRGRAP